MVSKKQEKEMLGGVWRTRTRVTVERAVATNALWIERTTDAAETFERRWSMLHLQRLNPQLWKLLREQKDLFHEATVLDTAEEIERQGAALCRGYQAACKAMDEAGEPDSSYMLGRCPRTGFAVAIGEQRPAAERVLEEHGGNVVWMTPDEVASILGLAKTNAAAFILTVKGLFPGAVITDNNLEHGS